MLVCHKADMVIMSRSWQGYKYHDADKVINVTMLTRLSCHGDDKVIMSRG